MFRERSRSPRRESTLPLVTFPSSSSIDSEVMANQAWIFDAETMELSLDGNRVKVLRFSDDQEMPWFHALIIVTFLGYKNITQTLEDHVYPEDKSSLGALIQAKGMPLRTGTSEIPVLGYNDLKALYLNEHGFYSLILSSQKPEAKLFKKFVCSVIMPSIRRTGYYRTMQLAQKERDETLALRVQQVADAVTSGIDTRLAKLEESLAKRDEENARRFGEKLLEILEPITTPLKNLTHNVSMHVRGAVKDVIDAAVTSPDSLLVRSFRSATRGPARRKTLDPVQYPEDQRATDLQQSLESLSLAQVAHALCPQMTYPAWKVVRGNFGKACLAERKRRGKFPPQHPQFIEKPLLWSFVGPSTNQGGGARRMYLQCQRELVEGVWRKLDKDGASFHSKAEKESLERPDESWPVNSAELDPPDFSSFGGTV